MQKTGSSQTNRTLDPLDNQNCREVKMSKEVSRTLNEDDSHPCIPEEEYYVTTDCPQIVLACIYSVAGQKSPVIVCSCCIQIVITQSKPSSLPSKIYCEFHLTIELKPVALSMEVLKLSMTKTPRRTLVYFLASLIL